MSDYTRRGIAGLCVAAVFALFGFALGEIDGSRLASDPSSVLMVVAGIVACASLIAIARGLF